MVRIHNYLFWKKQKTSKHTMNRDESGRVKIAAQKRENPSIDFLRANKK